ncbi:hypothetical protein ABMA28_007933 [Loxostege sticticalis]|uniref:Uncharacterized protein n=1 Tax=Loxostege sticticalis TaxID=481309 RepID=A0ABD0SJB1_LOXSC
MFFSCSVFFENLKIAWYNNITKNCKYFDTFKTSNKDHSTHLRRDGGLCFEIPPWQHKPVELDNHLDSMKEKFGNATSLRRRTQLVMVNSKILRRIKDEINNAVQKKHQAYKELTQLADQLNVPAMCDEDRRECRTVASKHVALIYACTEEARASIAKMGNYAEEMITITKNHMQASLDDVAKSLQTSIRRNKSTEETDVTACLKLLSRSAVTLGYELDLSLTNARRHNEQSHEKLSSCSTKCKRSTDDAVSALKDKLYQCVYA